MAELTTEQRAKLIDLCKQRVAADGIADVCDVAKGHGNEIGCDEINFFEAERVARLLSTNDRKYDIHQVGNHSYSIFLNRNYEIEESVKQTNKSVSDTNYWVKRASVASAVIALLTLVYIALDYYKDTSTNLEPLREQIKSTQAILDSIRVYQKGSEASLRTLANDSTKNVLIETRH